MIENKTKFKDQTAGVHYMARVLALGVIGFGAAALPTTAMAQSTLPTLQCVSDGYTVIDDPSVLQRIDPTTGSASNQGTSSITYNAIGYNVLDNYLYGLSSRNIHRMGANGATEDLGRPTGSSAFTPRSAQGTMDVLGNWYGLSNTELYIVPIGNVPAAGSLTFSTITRSGAAGTPNDFAFSVADDALYGVTGGSLRRIDPNTGVASIISTTGASLPGGAGGMWSDAAGTLYVYSNGSGQLFSVELSVSGTIVTGDVKLVSSVPANGDFDAASCKPPLLKKRAAVTEANAGTSYSYNYSIINAFAGSVNVNFNDPLMSGITFDTASVNPPAPGGGSVSVSASNLAITGVTVGGSSTLNFTASVDVNPSVADGTIIDNQATIALGAQTFVSDDPGTGAFEDPARVVIRAAPNADLSITKTNTPGVNSEVDQADDNVVAGSTTSYTLVVTNNGPSSVTGAVVTDTPGTGLTCPASNAVTITGDGVPSGTFTFGDLSGAGITLGTLADGEAATLTFSCTVN